MSKRARVVAVSVAALAIIGVGGGVAVATGMGGDSDQPITGDALQRASEAALQHTGGGRVTDTEAGDEDSYYEVEVTLDNGDQVDVQLDESFNVVSDETDHGEGESGSDSGEHEGQDDDAGEPEDD